MQISAQSWKSYVEKLGKLNKAAADAIIAYIKKHGFGDNKALIDYAFLISQKYGLGAAAISAAMYDAIVEASNKYYEPAEIADLPTYGDVAKTVYGVLKTSENEEEIAGAVSRLVKKAGCDTTLRNAFRDRAQYAWIPSGDTCAFCMGLAANGWVDISAKIARKGYPHAEHIHSNCDCTYAIRFSADDGVEGYDPDRYFEEIEEACDAQGLDINVEDVTWQQLNPEVINAVRRQNYARNKEEINAQKRAAYEKRQELNNSKAEESNTN